METVDYSSKTFLISLWALWLIVLRTCPDWLVAGIVVLASTTQRAQYEQALVQLYHWWHPPLSWLNWLSAKVNFRRSLPSY